MNSVGFIKVKEYAFLAVAALSLLTASCKINKDANCDNPKAACFKKDTEQPTVTSTNPVSTATMPTPTALNSLSSFTITFSEPMKNADQKSNYPNPTGSGSNGMTIASVSKIDDKNYQVIMSGTPIGGTVAFNFGALTDLSGNTLTNPTISFEINGITTNHDYVSSGGYTSVTLTWSNNTIYSVNYQVKKGTDCTTGTLLTGTNVDSLGVPITPTTQIVTTLAFGQFVDQTLTTVWVCQTLVGPGTTVAVSTSIGRDDSAPSTTASPTTTTVLTGATIVRFPATILLTCNNNYDQISYTINGAAPPGFPPPAPNLYPATGITLPLPTGTTDKDRTVKYQCRDKAGNVEAAAQTAVYKAEFQWADSGLYSEKWDWAYWK